jgi:hypothetical protein
MNASDTSNVVETQDPAATPETEGAEGTEEVQETPEVDLDSTEGIALALAGQGDVSVRDEDLPAVLEILRKIRTDAAKLVGKTRELLAIRKRIAQEGVAVMRLTNLGGSGKPDWGGVSGGFKLMFDRSIEVLFENEEKLTKGERTSMKNKERNAIRQHIVRVYREPAIRAYVWETTETQVAENGKDLLTLAGLPWSKDPDSPAFIHAVKNEYKRCDIAPPNKYLSAEEVAAKGTGAGPGAGPEDPAAVVRQAMAGSAQLAPHWAAAELLQGTTGLVQKITDLKSGEAYNRKLTTDYLSRVQYLADYLVRYIAGAAGTPEEEDVTSLFWGATDAEVVASV